jgi:hypothetical protein
MEKTVLMALWVKGGRGGVQTLPCGHFPVGGGGKPLHINKSFYYLLIYVVGSYCKTHSLMKAGEGGGGTFQLPHTYKGTTA